MQPAEVIYATVLRFLVFHYIVAENVAPGNTDSSQDHTSAGVRIRCPARSFLMQDIIQSAGVMRLDRLKKSVLDHTEFSAEKPNAFLDHVLAVNSRIYRCKTPIMRSVDRYILSRPKRDLHLGPLRSLHTELSVILDCVTTRQILPPRNGKKGVVILESTGPQIWELAKIFRGDDCQLEIPDDPPSLPIVRELKFKVQGTTHGEERDPANHRVVLRYGGGRGRRRRGGAATTKAPKAVPIDKEVEYPAAFKSHLSTFNKKNDLSLPPLRPKIVQQSKQVVLVEWKSQVKAGPVEFFRVEYMKDDGQNQWLSCHEGHLNHHTHSFHFDRLMNFRRYKFRVLAHYENGEECYSFPTAWYMLEKWA